MADVNKNSKYLGPLERRRIADSIGVSGLDFRSDLLLLQSAELAKLSLDFRFPYFILVSEIIISSD